MNKSNELIVPIWKTDEQLAALNSKAAEITEGLKQMGISVKYDNTENKRPAYSGIGRNKLRSLTDKEDCSFVLWIGSKRLIKRKLLDEYINKMYSI